MPTFFQLLLSLFQIAWLERFPVPSLALFLQHAGKTQQSVFPVETGLLEFQLPAFPGTVGALVDGQIHRKSPGYQHHIAAHLFFRSISIGGKGQIRHQAVLFQQEQRQGIVTAGIAVINQRGDSRFPGFFFSCSQHDSPSHLPGTAKAQDQSQHFFLHVFQDIIPPCLQPTAKSFLE